MRKRNVLNSPRVYELKKHRRKSFLNKALFFLFGFVVIFSLLAYLSHLKNLNINDIEITGNQVVDTSDIKNVVLEQTAGKYLWLFPKTNMFFYPENAIKNELQNKFKRLTDINIAIKNDKTLEVSVQERMPKYTWCGVEISAPDEKCYFMDQDGYIFDEAPYFSGGVYFKFYGLPGVGNTADPSGSYYSKQNFQQLVSFRDILVGFNLKPVAFNTTSGGDIEVYLSSGAPLTIGPKLIIRSGTDFQKVAENLETALTTEPLQTEFKTKYATLSYIDLRFGNKVYYRFSAQGGSASGGQ